MKKSLQFIAILLFSASFLFGYGKDVKPGKTLQLYTYYAKGTKIAPWIYADNVGTETVEFKLICNVYEDDDLKFTKEHTFSNVEGGKSVNLMVAGYEISQDDVLITFEIITKLDGDENPSNDTLKLFAHSNTLPRRVLWERFTNASCGPCAYAEDFNEKIIRANIDHVIPIYTHVWWPGASDPMYQENTSEARNRTVFYQCQGVPDVYFNGTTNPNAMSESNLNSNLDRVMQQGTGVLLNSTGTIENGKINVEVEIECKGAVFPGNNRLMVVLAEDNIKYSSPPGSNGESHFRYVMRKFHPSVEGTSVNLVKGEKINKSFEIELDQDWNHEECSVVVFVQNMDSKEVYQSAVMTTVTSVEDEKMPTEYSLEQNYPNPFNPTTKFSYSTPEESFIQINVYNLLGEKIKTLVNESKPAGKYSVIFDASTLGSGIYIYKMKTDKSVISKKMILIK